MTSRSESSGSVVAREYQPRTSPTPLGRVAAVEDVTPLFAPDPVPTGA